MYIYDILSPLHIISLGSVMVCEPWRLLTSQHYGCQLLRYCTMDHFDSWIMFRVKPARWVSGLANFSSWVRFIIQWNWQVDFVVTFNTCIKRRNGSALWFRPKYNPCFNSKLKRDQHFSILNDIIKATNSSFYSSWSILREFWLEISILFCELIDF